MIVEKIQLDNYPEGVQIKRGIDLLLEVCTPIILLLINSYVFLDINIWFIYLYVVDLIWGKKHIIICLILCCCQVLIRWSRQYDEEKFMQLKKMIFIQFPFTVCKYFVQQISSKIVLSLLCDVLRCLSSCFKHLWTFYIILHLSYLISVFFEIFKKINSILYFKIIYLSIHFSHIRLDVKLDYDNINTILLFSTKTILYFFSPLELYSWFYIYIYIIIIIKEKELQSLCIKL